MRLLIRTIMLCILIVSLPVQGVVAAIPMKCPMSHSSDAGPGTGSIDDSEAREMMTAQSQSRASVDDISGMPCHQGVDGKHSCRTCSACSIGPSAPPPFAPVISQAEQCVGGEDSPIPSFKKWIASRIERPPRG